MKTTLYTLNINDFAPDIRALTYPLMKLWAAKIGADFYEITERKFPDWPITYEKIQLYELSQRHDNDWTIFLDADTLVHPDFFDVTKHLPPYTVMFNGKDMAGHRFRYDRHFRRDGRFLGACNWCAIAPRDCVDLWHPLDNMTAEEAIANIYPVIQERVTGLIQPEHLIDDYTLSRNISRFHLNHTTLNDIAKGIGFPEGSPWLWHLYNITNEKKLELMHKTLEDWHIKVAKTEDIPADAPVLNKAEVMA